MPGEDEGIEDPHGGEGLARIDAAVKQEMGIEVVQVPFKELNAAWEAADKDQVEGDRRPLAEDRSQGRRRLARKRSRSPPRCTWA